MATPRKRTPVAAVDYQRIDADLQAMDDDEEDGRRAPTVSASALPPGSQSAQRLREWTRRGSVSSQASFSRASRHSEDTAVLTRAQCRSLREDPNDPCGVHDDLPTPTSKRRKGDQSVSHGHSHGHSHSHGHGHSHGTLAAFSDEEEDEGLDAGDADAADEEIQTSTRRVTEYIHRTANNYRHRRPEASPPNNLPDGDIFSEDDEHPSRGDDKRRRRSPGGTRRVPAFLVMSARRWLYLTAILVLSTGLLTLAYHWYSSRPVLPAFVPTTTTGESIETYVAEAVKRLSIEMEASLREQLRASSSKQLLEAKQSLAVEIEERIATATSVRQDCSQQLLGLKESLLLSLEERMKQLIWLFDADKTAAVDYALESMGGSIVSTRCSKTFKPHNVRIELMGFPMISTSPSPRTVIQATTAPGACWAFEGDKGFLLIRLARRIEPLRFTYEHAHPRLLPSHDASSAPRVFRVMGLHDEHTTDGDVLGTFEFKVQQQAPPLQTFELPSRTGVAYNYVQLEILSNHGAEYTCLYRFRVHGIDPLDPVPPSFDSPFPSYLLASSSSSSSSSASTSTSSSDHQ